MYTPSQGNLVNEKIKIQNSKNKSNPNFSVKQEGIFFYIAKKNDI